MYTSFFNPPAVSAKEGWSRDFTLSGGWRFDGPQTQPLHTLGPGNRPLHDGPHVGFIETVHGRDGMNDYWVWDGVKWIKLPRA